MKLRPAGPEDERRLLEWRNDPTTRSAAIGRDVIDAHEHSAWFERTLENPRCTMFVGEASGLPVGQVRFNEQPDGTAEVDITVAPGHRGRGHGAALLRLGCEAVGHRTLIALIRPENAASQRTFAKNGFLSRGQTVRRGVTLLVFKLERAYREATS